MRTLLHLPSVLLVCALAACADSTADQAVLPDDSTATPVAALSCVDLERTIVPAELTRAGLAQQFGAPDSVSSAAEPNRHMPGATDSIFAVHYPGFSATFRTPPGATDMVTSVAITENRYVNDARIGVGVSDSAVVALLGPPQQRTAATLVYDCGGAVEQPVTFELEHGRVRRINVAYYVD